jgi:hypothetical protein
VRLDQAVETIRRSGGTIVGAQGSIADSAASWFTGFSTIADGTIVRIATTTLTITTSLVLDVHADPGALMGVALSKRIVATGERTAYQLDGSAVK